MSELSHPLTVPLPQVSCYLILSQFGFGIVTLEDQQTSGCIPPLPRHSCSPLLSECHNHNLHYHHFAVVILTDHIDALSIYITLILKENLESFDI